MRSNRFALAVLFFIVTAAVCTAAIVPKDPLRLPNDEPIKAIYFFPHWWEPWKTDDSALVADLRAIARIGFNTVCLDHEVSQAIDRDWYWLDREYKLAAQEKLSILPWLQLQAVDRISLMKFSHLQLQSAVSQDGKVEEDCIVYRDSQFGRALAHYITVYLDRYINDPALLRIKHRGKLFPVVGLSAEVGWRTPEGLPLSFDDDTNAYFRKWMRASYHSLDQLNSKWGTSYKSFDEINPRDTSVFNYAAADKANMPPAVRDHALFRARLIGEALSDVARQVRKRHKNVIFVAEIAYPFNSDHPHAAAYRWNNANEYKAVEFADIIFIRTVGNTATGQQAKDQELIMLNGKRLILAYRFFADSSPSRAVAFALDCALSANGLACYNWNETADSSCALYDKPNLQALAKLMNDTYVALHNPDKRHELAAAPAFVEKPFPQETTESLPASQPRTTLSTPVESEKPEPSTPTPALSEPAESMPASPPTVAPMPVEPPVPPSIPPDEPPAR